MKPAKTREAMMAFQIAEARTLMAAMALALAIMLARPVGTAVAQVTVLLPTDGSGRAKFDIPRLSGQHASVLINQLMDIRSGLRVNPEMKDYMFDSDLTLQDSADMAAYLQSLSVMDNIAQGPSELVPRI
jgi:hypothetical protein